MFGQRFRQSCEDNPKLPEKNYGLYSFLQRRLKEDYDLEVSRESIRKWYSGESMPRMENVGAIAEILGVDKFWLMYGLSGMVEEDNHPPQPQKPQPFPSLKGCIHLVAGLFMVNDYEVTFIDDEDAHTGDFYVHVGNRKHVVAVFQGLDGMIGTDSVLFRINKKVDRSISIGFIPSGNFEFDLVRLDSISKHAKDIELTPGRFDYRCTQTGGRVAPAKTIQELVE